MREGLEAVFRAEDGERPRAILVGIEDGSGETEQMLDASSPSTRSVSASRSCTSCARAGASRRWCLIPSCLLLR